MDYAQAMKEVRAKKVCENYWLLRVSYDKQIVLPFKEGTALLAALTTAEQVKDGYGEKKQIVPLQRDLLEFRLMSEEEYRRYKVAALLDVSVDDLESISQATT